MLQLRPYQEQLLQDTRDAMKAGHQAVLDVLPTGGGKTVVAGALARRVQERKMRVWFLCHRDFLLHQTSLTFDASGVPHGFIAAGRADGMAPTMVCSVDTVRSRMAKMVERPELIVWDEAHHVKAQSWANIWAWAGPKCKHIGLTATPERLDGKGLGPPFQALVQGPTTAELMDMGNLSRYTAFAAASPDLTGVHTVAGEYNQRELQRAVDRSVITGDIVKTYQEKGRGMRAVYFCTSIDYSRRLAEAFCAAGIPAEHVDGETPTADRIDAAIRFAKGELQVLTNCSLFGEGYDLAAQASMPVTIDVVGLVRPTQSLALHLQQIGRCLRPKSYKAVILDHAGNLAAHGFPDEDRIWSLEGRTKKAKPPGIKTCPHCLAANKSTAVYCDACGATLVEKQGGRSVKHQDGELVEINAERLARERRAELRACRSYQDFVALGQARGYKSGWAGRAYAEWKKAEAAKQQRIEAQAAAYRR